MVASSHASSHARSHSPGSRGHCSRSRSHTCSYWSPSAGPGSSRAALPEESPRSRSSQSPSRASSRGSSAFPDGSRLCSRSRLWSPSQFVDEDRQEEQSSLDFVSVVATLWSLNELPEAPSESCNIRGSRAALKEDDQPASLYHLPVGSASGDILSDVNDRISSPSSGMSSKKV